MFFYISNIGVSIFIKFVYAKNIGLHIGYDRINYFNDYEKITNKLIDVSGYDDQTQIDDDLIKKYYDMYIFV